MKRKNNKECIVCSARYTYCPNCGDYSNVPKWKNIYHDENCKNIFEIASSYAHNSIDKEEAKKRFDECNLTNKEAFHKNIFTIINEVYNVKEETVDKKDDKNAGDNEIVKEQIEETKVVEATESTEVTEVVESTEKFSKKFGKKN